MFRSKTLFVVGAGASCEVGLPSGEKLKEIIASRLNIKFPDGFKQSGGDLQITDALRQYILANEQSRDINPYIHACRHIAGALPQAISIDNFIEAHQHDPRIELSGKLGIVRSILESEKSSSLYFDSNNNRKFNPDVGYVWYRSFFQKLTEGVSLEKINHLFQNVLIITFNYDRCIEHYLINSLVNYYGIYQEEARGLLNFSLRIFHPYGQVGRLPWQLDDNQGVEFGGTQQVINLLNIVKQIKTFTERVEEEKTLTLIRQSVVEAEVIVFLGFAFADQNMELLNPGKPSNVKKVFATAYGMSDHDAQDVAAEIARLLGRPQIGHRIWQNIEIDVRNDLTCAGLFRGYSRSMAR
jgi:hypothetical protein